MKPGPADVIVLPVVRIERDIDLGQQRLLPSSDRRKVVELRRVREALEMGRMAAERA